MACQHTTPPLVMYGGEEWGVKKLECDLKCGQPGPTMSLKPERRELPHRDSDLAAGPRERDDAGGSENVRAA